MIVAGFVLLAVGVADLIRQFLPVARWWIAFVAAALAVAMLGVVVGAGVPAVIALGVAGVWTWLMPKGAASRAGFWPAVGIAAVCGASVVLIGPRPDAGLLGPSWHVSTPMGAAAFDQMLLAVGAIVFLLESANVVVRAALVSESVSVSTDDDSPEVPARPILRGGRLIGPLERVIVFGLTLVAAYPILAAILAAKGIVRFPEISRDGRHGNQAEYFLIGSLVSWFIALFAAFLLWWGIHTPS